MSVREWALPYSRWTALVQTGQSVALSFPPYPGSVWASQEDTTWSGGGKAGRVPGVVGARAVVCCSCEMMSLEMRRLVEAIFISHPSPPFSIAPLPNL